MLSSATAAAGDVDLHRLWDDRCLDCHGHAGDFARHFLSVAGGELHGVHPARDLRQFLAGHYLPAEQVSAVYAMLLTQAQIPPRFQQECAHCHGSAAEFARQTLELRAGVLYARRSGLPVRDFLRQHRRLQAQDVEFFTEVLTRVASEVRSPAP